MHARVRYLQSTRACRIIFSCNGQCGRSQKAAWSLSISNSFFDLHFCDLIFDALYCGRYEKNPDPVRFLDGFVYIYIYMHAASDCVLHFFFGLTSTLSTTPSESGVLSV